MFTTARPVPARDSETAGPSRAERVDVGLVRPSLTARARQRVPVPRSMQRLLGPLLVLAAWQLCTVFDLVDERTLPEPSQVLLAAVELTASGELQQHLAASLSRVGVGLVLGMVAGLALAVAAGLTRVGENLLDTNMEIVRAVPNVAFLPLLMVWMGIGETLKVVFIALTVAIAIYINTFASIRQVDAGLVEAARTFGVRRWGMIRTVVLPGALPGFLVGLRLALTALWVALVFAETINAPTGLGKLMNDSRQYFQLDVMFVVICIYALLGLLSHALIRFLEHVLLDWQRSFRD
jgi:sulfonate transport system permease protein